METLIDARAVHSYYGSSHVLRGVDFRVATGETVGLLGRNGMGKTTLLRSLLGHVKPRRGEIRVRGIDMTGDPPERIARQGIAYGTASVTRLKLPSAPSFRTSSRP